MEGGDRVEEEESPKGERAVKPVISLPSKIGTEDWVLKGIKLITNAKKSRLKIYLPAIKNFLQNGII